MDLAKKARLQLLRLEDRVVPTTSIGMIDAIGFVGKTVAVTVTHNQVAGDVEGRVDWKDGKTTEFTSWSYTTASKTFTHTYDSSGTYAVETEAKGGSVDDSETITIKADVPPVYAVDTQPSMEFGAYATSSGNNPTNTSVGMVRYADGVVDLHFPDLESTGFGMPFGITRSWSNGPGYDNGTDLGFGWNINQLPTVVQVNGTNTLSIVIDGNEARTFDVTTTPTVYQERFFGQHKLVHDTVGDFYVLTTPGGVVYKFRDFTVADAPAQGTFDSRTDANGNVISVYARSSGYITDIRRDNGVDVHESWQFAYASNKIASVTLRRGSDTNSFTNYRKVEYTYYNNEDHGNNGDLKLATIKDGSDNTISKQYFRYFVPGEADGFAGALKMYVGFASYERADTALDPLTAADTSLDDYADLLFEYDTSRRVTLQKVQGMGCSMCSAGVGEYTFSYSASGHGAPSGANHWATKTTETLPDGHQNIVYTNAFGQVMQFVQKDTDTNDQWRTHYVYDGQSRLLQQSFPSATTNVNESNPTLLVTNGARLGFDNEFLVNTTTAGAQSGAAVARDWAGNYVVTWTSANGDDSSGGIYAQRFNAIGTPQGIEFRVNSTTGGLQTNPSIAMDEDGDFVVVWESYVGSTFDIHGQRFNAAGETQGNEFLVNENTTTNNQSVPAVAMDGDGNFAVTWTHYNGSNNDVYARRYNSSGTALANEAIVNSTTANEQWSSSIAMDNDGDFVIVWETWGQDGSSAAVYAQRFNSSGIAQGSEFRVNTTTTGLQGDPAVAMDYDGDFVVAWSSYTSGNYDVYAKRYNSSGSAVVGEFRVNSYTTNWQYLSALACNAGGDFMVVWSSDGQDSSSTGVYGQFYTSGGTGGGAFRINSYTTNSQWYPSIASDYDGDFIVAWSGAGTDDSSGIFARQLERAHTYIADTAGYVARYQYARATTIASDSSTGTGSAGDIAGFLKATWIVQGEIDGGGNNLIKQSAMTYFLHSDGSNTVSPLATSTVFRNDNGTGGQTTSYDYTFDKSSLTITQVEVTHPIVTTSQNGPNEAVVESSVIDRYGRTVWHVDGGGYLVYQEFDDASGAVTYRIDDVDSSETGDFEGDAPSATPGNGGLHLIGNTTVDFMGRQTTIEDPNGNVTYVFYNDPGHEIRVYPGWDESEEKTTGPTQVYREDWARSYIEMLTMSATPNTSASIPLGTEAISDLESLSRVVLNTAGQPIYRDEYWQLDTYSVSPAELVSGDFEHYRSETQYAARGGIKKTVTPTGTITRYIRDSLNRVIEVWIGTDDEPDTSYWPNETEGTDLVQVYSYTYDSGGIGDGNLTEITAMPGGDADDRVTDCFYDWRNRPMAIKVGIQGDESLTTDTQRPIYYFVYDNLNQITESQQYDGDDVNITITGGVPEAPSSSLLRAKMTTTFDDLGRVYRESIYSVDSTDGSVGSSLDTNTWYDKRGNVIKILHPTGLVSKLVYDGAGRMTTVSYTNGGSDPSPGASSNWASADDVTGDTVHQEIHYLYDSNSNVIQVTTKERKPDAVGTAELGDIDSQPYARVSFIGDYYDRVNRLVAHADIGDNDGNSWTVDPNDIPNGSGGELVTSFDYSLAGDVTLTIDPRGIEKHDTYDAMHRLTQSIEGYDDGIPSNGNDRTTTLEYDGMNHLVTRTLWLDDEEFEQTAYVYGVEVGVAGNAISSNDLLGVIYYPDPETGGPSPAQFQYSYNALGEQTTMTDANSVVHDYLYDVIGRPTDDSVGSVRLNTAYDTAGRAYLFTTFDGEDNEINQVLREFNGFGQVTREFQEANGAVDTDLETGSNFVSYSYGGPGSQLSLISYPFSEMELRIFYDDIGRPATSDLDYYESPVVLEGSTYLGLSTVVGRELAYTPGLTQSIALDRFGRVNELVWNDMVGEGEEIEPVVIEHFKYAYDPNGNVLYRTNELDHTFDELYHKSGMTEDEDRYDKLNQMVGFVRGALSDTEEDGDDLFDTVDSSELTIDYTRDGVGNVTSIETNETPMEREFDRQNRLISHDENDLHFDAAGNLYSDDLGNAYAYDAWNRLVLYNDTHEYVYDALGRRIKEGNRSFVLSLDGKVLSEMESGTPLYQYVWSITDNGKLVARTDGLNVFYALTDTFGNVTAIVGDTSGEDGVNSVLERYVYDPQGNFVVWNSDWSSDSGATSGNDWVYCWGGGRWDGASQVIIRSSNWLPRLSINLGITPGLVDQPPKPQNPPAKPKDPKQECLDLADSVIAFITALINYVKVQIAAIDAWMTSLKAISNLVTDEALQDAIDEAVQAADTARIDLTWKLIDLEKLLDKAKETKKKCNDPNKVKDTIDELKGISAEAGFPTADSLLPLLPVPLPVPGIPYPVLPGRPRPPK